MSTTTKPVNQKAWFLILPVLICVAFSAILPLMTVVNYSVQDIISPQSKVFVGTEWFGKVIKGALADHCHGTNPRLASVQDYEDMLAASM